MSMHLNIMQKKKNVPAFLRNTYEMLQREDLSEIVSWAESGNGFVIKNLQRFSQEILPQYFKHKKYTSFVRQVLRGQKQLNMYGFHKQRHHYNNYHQFAHEYFRKGNIEAKVQDTKMLLAAIRRKPEKKKKVSEGQSLQENQDAPQPQEVESFSDRSVSMVLEDEKSKEKNSVNEKSKQNLTEKQDNLEDWSDCSSEQVDQQTEKVMQQNELIKSLHNIIRSQVLLAKKRSLMQITNMGVSSTSTEEKQSITKLTQLLLQGADLSQKILQDDLAYP